jgi:hypothetical protein
MKNNIKFLSLGFAIFFLLNSTHMNAQQFYRIRAEYTVKYKDTRGNQVLQMGATFYDSNNKILVIKNGFPVREILAQKDTSIYQIRNEKLVGKSRAYALVDLSIFHMALTVQLNNYGLDKAGYHLENVKSDKGLILTKWAPPEKTKDYLGKILVSTKEKQLYSIVFLDTDEKIIAKHIFRDYKNIDGFVFPREVLRITYENNEETSYKLTSYKNVRVNETGRDEEYYNYKIPQN